MPTPENPKLYAKVKAEADRLYATPGAYKSGWIVKTYKARGGTYAGRRKPSSGLSRWFREKWIDVARTRSPCGRKSARDGGPYPVCRPSVRVTPKTPKTVRELSRRSLRRAMRDKQRLRSRGSVSFEQRSPKAHRTAGLHDLIKNIMEK